MAKISKLRAKDPIEAVASKPKILIYGAPGVGKTYTSLDFPKVYYIDTEGGANRSHYTAKLKASGGAYMGPEDGTLDGAVIIEQIQALATEDHDFKTVVIDSVSKIFGKIVADEAERLGEKDAFGASKKPAVAWMRRLMNWVDRIDMSVIFIAHQKDVWGPGQVGKVGESFDAWEKLEYELDLSLQIQKRGNSRVALPKKSRLEGFPEGEAFPWSYAEFAKRYGEEVIAREVKKIELASPEQLARISELLTVLKVEQAEIDKWFSAAKVETWAEMDTERAGKAIKFLEAKVK